MDLQEEIFEEELEDGELSSNSSDDYTPLERPENYSQVPQSVIQDSESEDQDQSSDVDSDDSTSAHRSKPKKPKMKLKPQANRAPNSKKKYDIWTAKVQEDVLTETLNICDVTQKDRSRDVESYDYPLANNYERNGNSNKRTRDDRRNIHLRLGKRDEKDEKEKGKGACRDIPDLKTTSENTEEEVAKDMANKLCEQKEDLIVKALKFVGKEKCFELFKKTQEIEAEGGMSVMNYTRRRTPGGVFLHLLKMDDSISREQKTEIFMEEKRKDSKEKKRKQSLKMRQQRAKDHDRTHILPQLLSKADLLIKNRHLKEISEADFKNPPPTPETDGHENSCDDGSEVLIPINQNDKRLDGRELVDHDDDVLDVHCSTMDMF